MSIAIVTDSTADIPTQIIREHHIQVIPAMLIVDDKSFADGEGISREEFYKNLPTYQKPPSTSAPSIGHFQQVYQSLLHGEVTQIVSIHVSSAFSGIYNIACVAAEAFKNRVKVIDSGQVTLGLGFQVIAAAEAAARGHTVEEIHRILMDINRRVHFYALLDTLEYLRRSGRVNWAAATLGNILSLKVMIEVRNSQVFRVGLFRSRRQGFETLMKYLSKIGSLERLALVYTQLADQNEIRHLLDAVTSKLNSQAIITPVTTVIGTHVGPNGVGFIAVSS